MNVSPRVLQHGNQIELEQRLVELISQKDHGLLSQRDYENALEEIRAKLPEDHLLLERELSNGGVRFLVRERTSGRHINMFEFQIHVR